MSGETEIKGEYPFAELAKRQQRQPRGRGRPLKGVRRDPTTIYLTEAERETLGRMQVQLQRYFAVNRSELVGVATAVLNNLVEEAVASNSLTSNDLDAFQAWALEQLDFIKSKNQKKDRRRVR
jgi:hypothetical protein